MYAKAIGRQCLALIRGMLQQSLLSPGGQPWLRLASAVLAVMFGFPRFLFVGVLVIKSLRVESTFLPLIYRNALFPLSDLLSPLHVIMESAHEASHLSSRVNAP